MDGHLQRQRLADDLYGGVLVGLDFPAQPADLHVDRAVVDLVVVQPREAEELVARQHVPRRGKEGGEEVELVIGERDVIAVWSAQAPQPYVQLESGEAIG